MRIEHCVVSVPLWKCWPNEDAWAIARSRADRPFFAAVVDGHGGEMDECGDVPPKSSIVAEFAQTVAFGLRQQFILSPRPEHFPAVFDAIARATDATFYPLVEAIRPPAKLSVGAVASALTITRDRIHLAQAGDCRLYKAVDSVEGFKVLSRDHNGANANERERVRPFEASGLIHFMVPSDWHETHVGRVLERMCRLDASGEWLGSIEPTRGFGDWKYRPAMTHVPECVEIPLTGEASELFALCSDGGNKIVEAVLCAFRGQTEVASLWELEIQTLRELRDQDDDVTILYFRVRPK